jgi:hypothetical protein
VLAPADITQIDDGLWRWTARHPEWVAGAKPGSAADWPREVGSVAYSAGDVLVLIDALVPEGGEALWAWLDERVAEHRGRVAAVNTIKWHRRSRDAVVRRYGATTSRARSALPDGVVPIPIRGAGETMLWLPRPRALVAGDRLLGGPRAGRLRLCPPSWLAYLDRELRPAGLAEALRPLLELPVERVLVSHGPPVLRHGHAAIERALSLA